MKPRERDHEAAKLTAAWRVFSINVLKHHLLELKVSLHFCDVQRCSIGNIRWCPDFLSGRDTLKSTSKEGTLPPPMPGGLPSERKPWVPMDRGLGPLHRGPARGPGPLGPATPRHLRRAQRGPRRGARALLQAVAICKSPKDGQGFKELCAWGWAVVDTWVCECVKKRTPNSVEIDGSSENTFTCSLF